MSPKNYHRLGSSGMLEEVIYLFIQFILFEIQYFCFYLILFLYKKGKKETKSQKETASTAFETIIIKDVSITNNNNDNDGTINNND